ncbi:MAG: sensor histidine kinase [Actinomycetota bacterium]
MTHAWARLSLGTKLLFASLAVEVMMLTLLLVSTLTVMDDSLDLQFRQRRGEIDQLLNAALAGHMAAHDLGALQDVLDAVRSERGIRRLELRDQRGQVVAASGQATPGAQADRAELPITLAGTTYGTLAYDVDTGFFAQARQRLLKSGSIIALALLALSAVVLTALSVLITGRLVHLADTAAAIARGDLAARVQVGQPDEVGRLAVSFNAMAEALAARMRALAESEEKFSKAFADGPDPMLILGPDHRIIEVNAAFERTFHLSRAVVIGNALDDLWPGRHGAALAEAIGEGERVLNREVHLPHGDGLAICLLSAEAIELAGSPGRIAILRDITERKAIEEALARSNADLEQFAWVASHDLREPLRMVSVYVELLRRRYGDSLDGEARDFIAFASEGAQRMDRLILDLLQYSLVSRDGRPLVPTRLADHVEAACANLRVAIDECGGAVQVDGPLPVVLGDGEQLARLMQNLIGNGLKYRAADRAPLVRISAARADGEWVVSVADNGIGIEPQYFDRIFQLFQRLHGRETYDGTGIGLAVCRRIVERHHGRLWVESEPDRGSVFRFTLPAPPEEGTP